jgi:hypothetical protein
MAACVAGAGALTLVAQDQAPPPAWPRSIEVQSYRVTVYQPQTDRYDGDMLAGRAAVSVARADGSGEPVFGAIWFEARLDINRQERVARLRRLSVPEVRFVDSTESERQRLAELLEQEIPKWDLAIDLDRLVAGLDTGAVDGSTSGLRHDPPVFIHSTDPAVLVPFDGKPVVAELEGSVGLEYVVNTPFPVVRQSNGATFYLFGGNDLWYSAADPLGPWAVTRTVPPPVRRITDGIETAKKSTDAPAGPSPRVITATEPSELVVTEGEPRWAAIDGLDLLYCENTTSDVFLDVASQRYFVLVSGRWYAGEAVGDVLQWAHVPNDELPESFSDIPPDSPKGSVLVHVAGTAQARREVIDSRIPDIRAVRLGTAAVEVRYDGEPEFRPVDGAEGVRYAANTAASVFQTGNMYYLCDNAVWYRAGTPTGPWAVATSVPSAIYAVPPSNPHHQVTYVRVYDATPEVAYVGYTSGYVGNYVSNGSVVWGTGWSYTPWYGTHYYAFPWTWGLHMGYHPWSGWGVGVGWVSGPFQITVGWTAGPYGPYSYGGWYGPMGWMSPVPRGPVYVNPSPGMPAVQWSRPGIYDKPAMQNRVAPPRPMGTYGLRTDTAGTANDVFTDRSGNVYRQDSGGGWQERQGGTWNAATGLDRGAGATATRPSLEADARARQQGATRSSQFRGGGGR